MNASPVLTSEGWDLGGFVGVFHSASMVGESSIDEGQRNSPIMDSAFANSSFDGRDGRFSKVAKPIAFGFPRFLGRKALLEISCEFFIKGMRFPALYN